MERALHKDLYHFILARGWPTFFALVAVTFLGANLLFASLYLAQPGCIAHARPGSFEDAFYFSVQTLATIGYGGMYPVTRYAHIVVVGRGDDRHPRHRADHRADVHALRAAVGARAVLEQGRRSRRATASRT